MFEVKKYLKFLFKCLFFLGKKPTVIASTGRSGSTMLTNAVVESLVAARFNYLPAFVQAYLKRGSIEYLDRISDITKKCAPVLKTHDLFRDSFAQKAKYIFIFGDPLESAQSVQQMGLRHGAIWIEEHIYHLAGEGYPHEIFEKDVLNYEAQMESWGAAEGVFVVHYEDLWDKEMEISQFLGFEVSLPNRRPRTKKPLPSNFDKPLFDHLKRIELDLRARKRLCQR